MADKGKKEKKLIDCENCDNTLSTKEQGLHSQDIQKCRACIVVAINKLAA